MEGNESIYGPIVAGLFSIAGSAYQNQQNEKAATVAYLRQRQLIKEANIYNAPINQMARLREAGLNPNLIYGNGPGNMISASAGTPPAAHHENVMQNIGIYATMRQIANEKRQLDLQERDIKLREAQNPSIIKKNEAEADKTNSEIDVNTQTMLNMMQSREHQNQLIELNKESIRLANAMQDFTLEERKRLSPLIELNQILQNKKILNDINVDNIRVAIENELKNSSILLNDAQIHKIGSEYKLNMNELKFLRGVNVYRYYQEKYQGLKSKDYLDTPGNSYLHKVGRYLEVAQPIIQATAQVASTAMMLY